MRVTGNRSGLRWRVGIAAFGLLHGLLALLVFAVASCGGAEPENVVGTVRTDPTSISVATPAKVVQLGDGSWVLKSLDGGPIVEDSFVMLEIDAGLIHGYDGCNRYGGQFEDGTSVTDADGVFSVPPAARTLRDCGGPLGVMDQADAYLSALLEGERYRVAGERLEILDSDGAVRLIFVRQVPLEGRAVDLSGTAWRLMKEGDADGDVGAATMAFLDDRLVIGETACRPYLATYNRSEEGVRFPSKAMLERSHSCSDEARWLEGEFGDFLTWAREYAVQEEGGSSRLRMRDARGKTLRFEPLPPAVDDVAGTKWTLLAITEFWQDEGGMWLTRTDRAARGADLTLSFYDGGISGVAGCNSYGSEAELGDGSITLNTEMFFYTAMFCDVEGVMAQEERYLELLPRVTRYGVYGDHLFMQTEDDVFVLFRLE